MSESRIERKERTRRSILDAALALSAETGLATLSLRAVAKEVGIVPTAFYRHFDSVEALGLALVDESFDSLRALLREVRSVEQDSSATAIADRSVDALVGHVEKHPEHFRFIARERLAGPRAVRAAVRREVGAAEQELTDDLALLPGTDGWREDDLRELAALFVTLLVAATERLLVADEAGEAVDDVVASARTRLRMVLFGALGWRAG